MATNNGNHGGGSKKVAATYEALTEETYGMRNMHLRSESGNGLIEIAKRDGTKTGFLNGGEGLSLQNMRPADVFVKGTAGDCIYFIGDRA